MKLPKFIILTEKSILDIPYENDEQHEKDSQELVAEQDKILESMMYKRNSKECYLIHFFNSAFFDEMNTSGTIDDAIEYLAIKDGIDLVQFENGNIGYVAYYSGNYNGFEIVRDRYKEEENE